MGAAHKKNLTINSDDLLHRRLDSEYCRKTGKSNGVKPELNEMPKKTEISRFRVKCGLVKRICSKVTTLENRGISIKGFSRGEREHKAWKAAVKAGKDNMRGRT